MTKQKVARIEELRECHLGLETDDFAKSRSILKGSRRMVDAGQVEWLEAKKPFSLRALNGRRTVTDDGVRDLYTVAQDAYREPDSDTEEHIHGNIRVELVS